jgi:hypothetical protein
MEAAVWLILIGLCFVDWHLWKLVLDQRRHNQATESLLAEIRDRLAVRSN